MTEGFHFLAATLRILGVGRSIASVAITAPEEAVGRASISAGAAVALAASKLSVALVCADVRNPVVERLLGVSASTGTAAPLDEGGNGSGLGVEVPVPEGRLVVLPAHPSDVSGARVSGSDFQGFLRRVSGEVDVVVIDTPPVLDSADALFVAQHCDAVLLVATTGTTRSDDVEEALERLPRGLIHVIGTVLQDPLVSDADRDAVAGAPTAAAMTTGDSGGNADTSERQPSQL